MKIRDLLVWTATKSLSLLLVCGQTPDALEPAFTKKNAVPTTDTINYCLLLRMFMLAGSLLRALPRALDSDQVHFWELYWTCDETVLVRLHR